LPIGAYNDHRLEMAMRDDPAAVRRFFDAPVIDLQLSEMIPACDLFTH
jgi:hypothetical protein